MKPVLYEPLRISQATTLLGDVWPTETRKSTNRWELANGKWLNLSLTDDGWSTSWRQRYTDVLRIIHALAVRSVTLIEGNRRHRRWLVARAEVERIGEDEAEVIVEFAPVPEVEIV